jgi:hypothetical protein
VLQSPEGKQGVTEVQEGDKTVTNLVTLLETLDGIDKLNIIAMKQVGVPATSHTSIYEREK